MEEQVSALGFDRTVSVSRDNFEYVKLKCGATRTSRTNKSRTKSQY